MTLDDQVADRLAGIALGHVQREWPHGLQHVWTGPNDGGTPRTLHPVFFGSFDWHSCVHGYWLLAVLLRRFPAMSRAPAIRTLLDTRLTSEAVAGECAYFARPATRGFERPYGWAWLLALQHALRATPWEAPLRPLADVIVARFRSFLPLATYPVRVGTHFNTAFAWALAHPYAAAHHPDLAAALRGRVQSWYGQDQACQAWEPNLDEFLSPALVEAMCMARLHPASFAPWLDAFLPGIAAGQPATLFEPATPTDRKDGKIAHLDGLNLSRAWCWRAIAKALPPADPRRATAEAAATHHLAASAAHVSGDFMGEHWLATFAVLAMWPEALD